MIGEKHGFLVAELGGNPLTFRLVERQAVVVVVIGNAVMEPDGILLHGFDPAALDHGERRGIGHMRVQHNLGVGRRPVGLAVNEQGRRFDRMIAFEDVAVRIAHQHARRRYFGPVETVRIDQKRVVVQRHAEMVADAFVEAEPHGPPIGGRQVDSQLFDIFHGSPLFVE